ncbi:hypothetical protein [Rhizomonospora bruguierae]|uniref:hypothetical protein n=1 Tax=Rhizomonospora bruguierae TaxID=1581705 RepID=UPI001BCE2B1C|nr:hypothetical protein [Micromonospora sp. NBRC 107566]
MEADLSRHHQIDLCDRWRFDEHGRRRLTLRQIYVRLRDVPAHESAVAAVENGGAPPPSRTEVLLMQLIESWSGKDHPLRDQLPKHDPEADPERQKARAQAKRRARERQRQIEAGEIT